MNKSGPIVIIEDDLDDQALFSEVLEELKVPNQLLFFPNGLEALNYIELPDSNPFLIISDINMPVLNGFDLRNKIFSDPRLNNKCVPYIFFSTSVTQTAVVEAYGMSVQGFFLKPNDFVQFKDMMRSIINYWGECYAPSNFENQHP